MAHIGPRYLGTVLYPEISVAPAFFFDFLLFVRGAFCGAHSNVLICGEFVLNARVFYVVAQK